MKEEADIKKEIAEAKRRLKLAENELKNMDLLATLAVHKRGFEILGFINSEKDPCFFFKERGEYAITLRYNKSTKKFRCVVKKSGHEKAAFSVRNVNELESFIQSFIYQETKNIESYKRQIAHHEIYLEQHLKSFELAFNRSPAR